MINCTQLKICADNCSPEPLLIPSPGAREGIVPEWDTFYVISLSSPNAGSQAGSWKDSRSHLVKKTDAAPTSTLLRSQMLIGNFTDKYNNVNYHTFPERRRGSQIKKIECKEPKLYWRIREIVPER